MAHHPSARRVAVGFRARLLRHLRRRTPYLLGARRTCCGRKDWSARIGPLVQSTAKRSTLFLLTCAHARRSKTITGLGTHCHSRSSLHRRPVVPVRRCSSLSSTARRPRRAPRLRRHPRRTRRGFGTHFPHACIACRFLV